MVRFAHLVSAVAVAALAVSAQAAQIDTVLATPISIPSNIDGVYLYVPTGATSTLASPPAGWDFNPYNNGAGLTFYGNGTPQGILASGTAGTTAVAQLLTPGSVVSPTPAVGFYNQFQTLGTLFQPTTGTQYVGFRFTNEATGVINYGYAGISTTPGTGFPASIVSYGYENTGAAVTVPSVPEPTSLALLSLGGLAALRRRRA